jgi:hypothetical protein
VGTGGEHEQGYVICRTYHLSILEREERNKDIRLHDGENEMRGEGGEDRWWPETLYKSH